jgi:two-component system response regulator
MRPLVLIVDDRPEDIELTEMALSMLDHDIGTERVFTGEQALDFLKAAEHLPAMILLDLKMPGMGGIETLRRIRADERLKNIPVVIVTCSILESDMQTSLEAGAAGFVHKAIRLHEFSENLGQQVKCWLGK